MEASTFKSQELCKNKALLERNALETITSRNNSPRKQCSYLARLRLEWYFSAKSECKKTNTVQKKNRLRMQPTYRAVNKNITLTF